MSAKLKTTKKKKEEEGSPHRPPRLPFPPHLPLPLPPAILLRSILAMLPLFLQLATILTTRHQVQVDGHLSGEDSSYAHTIRPIRKKQEVPCGVVHDDNNITNYTNNNHNNA